MKKIPCRLCEACGLYRDLTVLTCRCGADLSGVPVLLVDADIPAEQCGLIDLSLPVYMQKCSACGAEHFTADPAKRIKVCHSCHKARIASVEPVLYVPEEKIPAEVRAEEADDDEEDAGAGSWASLLGRMPAPAPPELTLTAIRHGQMTVTLRADQTELPYLLGRSANCAEFLRRDLRVGNEHCFLAFQGGSWIVIDNHSANGTAVNGQFLEYNGQKELHDGDELMLGHHPDSVAFLITIRP